jgi:hypothetical protein
MKKFRMDRALMLLFTLITLSFTATGFTSRFGLDYYEFYLNNKFLAKQYVNQPLNQRVLQLDKAKPADQLQISYTHCMNKGVGTGRNLMVKDEAGHTLQKWTFAEGSEAKMSIAVKDLLQLANKNKGHELKLYYSAQELSKGEMLSMIRFK